VILEEPGRGSFALSKGKSYDPWGCPCINPLEMYVEKKRERE
jgi:hypothetical protein